MFFNVYLGLAVVQSDLKLDYRACCESRSLKMEVSQQWINAQCLATFNSPESAIVSNKPTLLEIFIDFSHVGFNRLFE